MLEPTLDNTLGALFIGSIVVACLLGVTTYQTYTYYERCQEDRMLLKILGTSRIGRLMLIYLDRIVDVVHAALLAHTVYLYAVVHFGKLLALIQPTRSVLISIMLTMVTVLTALVANLAPGPKSTVPLLYESSCPLRIQAISCTNRSSSQWDIYLGLSSASLSDICICVTLCILLAKRDRGPRRRKVDTTIRTLQVYIVNTGFSTSIWSLLTLIMYAIGPNTMVYLILFCILPKLFLNALLAMLNARKSLREQMNGDVISIPLTSLGAGGARTMPSYNVPSAAEDSSVDQTFKPM
ncbi:hypothetical protein C8Q76DRAFT_688270 [Earliella scabrosa]|nr:hypothetical protein C8Q76DRAFT_688270 [Earliella scabrosa]